MQPARPERGHFMDALSRETALLQAQFPDLADRLSRARALLADGRLFVEESGREAMVRSSDGTTWYPVNGTCPCPASQHHSEPCKHRLAFRLYQKVCDRLATEEERYDLAPGAPHEPVSMPPEHITIIQGRPFVKFEGLLSLAHARGLVELRTTLVHCALDLAVCQAVARFQDGR